MHPYPVERWLRRQVATELITSIALGLVSLLAAVIVLALTFWLSFVVFLALGSRVALAAQALGGARPGGLHAQAWMAAAAFLFMVLLFIGSARSEGDYLDELPRMRLMTPLSPPVFAATGKMMSDVLYLGPRLVFAALSLFHKAALFSRFNIEVGARILALLAARSGRVSFREITERVAGTKPAQVFPCFRHLDGIVFLTREPAGLSLTAELRAELRNLLGIPRPPDDADADAAWQRRPDSFTAIDPCFSILGLAATATLAEAKAAYRRLVKEHHPDRVIGLGDELRELAEEKCKEINQAYKEVCRRLDSSIPSSR